MTHLMRGLPEGTAEPALSNGQRARARGALDVGPSAADTGCMPAAKRFRWAWLYVWVLLWMASASRRGLRARPGRRGRARKTPSRRRGADGTMSRSCPVTKAHYENTCP